MRVIHLSLTDFRNYSEASLAMIPGVNVFVGLNGQGKTNLVEAVGYLSSLSSHRISTDQALIRSNKDSAIIRARIGFHDRERLVEIQINRHTPNRAQLNRVKIPFKDVPLHFSSVLFAPEDLSLIRGEPSTRRRFFDSLLVVNTPRLSAVMADYERVVKQRNSLLKSARGLKNTSVNTLDIWDERLILLGTEIIQAREKLIQDLFDPVYRAYLTIAGSDHHPRMVPVLSIDNGDGNDGKNTSEIAERFHSALTSVRYKEYERGITLCGPHRDDVFFELNGLPAKGYASHGESWSFALALRLGSAELLREQSQAGDPVLILDDVFAELDQTRRDRLAAAVSGFEQVLITAAVFEDVPHRLIGHTVSIEKGKISANESDHGKRITQ